MSATALENITSRDLPHLKISDLEIGPVWVKFTSKAGKRYTAVHVPRHPKGPYLLLCSEDKDRKDFAKVSKMVEKAMWCKADGRIGDRGDDICDVLRFIRLPFNFFELMSKAVTSFYEANFLEVTIPAIYLDKN